MNRSKYCVLLLALSMAAASFALSGCDSDGGTLKFLSKDSSNKETAKGVCRENKECKPSEECRVTDGKGECVPKETSGVEPATPVTPQDPQGTQGSQNPTPQPQNPPPKPSPQPPQPQPQPQKKAYGESCSQDDECAGGACAREGKWGELGGYCTRLNSQSAANCSSGGARKGLCAKGLANNAMCLQKCRIGARDCRSGFECIGQGANPREGVCYPEVAEYPGNSKANIEGVQCVQTEKDVVKPISVMIPPGTSSFIFTAWMFDETARVYLGYAQAANGQTIDFAAGQIAPDVHKYPKLFVGVTFAGSVSTMMMPLSPKLKSFVQEGLFTVYAIPDRTGTLCYRVLSERSPGDTIDLNFYLVGVKSKDRTHDLTVDEARTDPDILRMIEKLRSVYAKKGINIRVRRYYTLPPKLVERYRIYRQDSDQGGDPNVPKNEDFRPRELHSLFQRSMKPGSSLDDLLSVNVFLVESLVSAGGTVGISGAIAAAPGLHGVVDSGLLFTTEYLRGNKWDGTVEREVDGASYTALIMAHELGHYLGLPHTSEKGIPFYPSIPELDYDSFSDTPECPANVMNGHKHRCPDVQNLMFPVAGWLHENLSDQQADTLRASVLTK